MTKYGRIILWLIIVIGVVTYYLQYLSFTKYNVCPIKECDDYLEKTYGKKFQRDCGFVEFQKDRGDYYLWKYRYFDETGSEFYECYLHPHANSETSPHLFFRIGKRETGVVDYYWQLQLQKEFGEKLHLEQYQQVIENSTIHYEFEIQQESDIDNISNVIAETLYYTFQHVPEINEAVVSYAVYDREHCIFLLSLKPGNEVWEYIGRNKEQIYDYVYDEICKKYQKEEEDVGTAMSALTLSSNVSETVSESMRISILAKDYCSVNEFTDLEYYLFCDTRLHKSGIYVHDWETKPAIIGQQTKSIDEAKELYLELKTKLPVSVDEQEDTYIEYVSPDCKWMITTRWLNKATPEFGRKQMLFYEGEKVKESEYLEGESFNYSECGYRVVQEGGSYGELEEAKRSKYNALSDKVYSEDKIYNLVMNEEGTLAAGATAKWEEVSIRDIESGRVIWSFPLQEMREEAQSIRNEIQEDTYLGYPQVIQFQGNEKEGRIVVQGGRSSFYEIAYPSGEMTYLGEYMYSLCFSPDGKYAAYSDVDYDNGVDMDLAEQNKMAPGIYIMEVATGKTAYLYWDPFSDPDEDYMETRSFMWIEKEVFDSYMGNMMPE